MSESLSAHDINTGISSQYESIVACYILHLYLSEPLIAFWAIVVDKGCYFHRASSGDLLEKLKIHLVLSLLPKIIKISPCC